MTEHLSTPELIRALGGADAICRGGCSCRGQYAGPERRATHRPIEQGRQESVNRGVSALLAPAPDCPYCNGTGTLVYQDEAQPCYCQQPDADVAAKA